MNETLRDKFRGCLIGLAVGDAIGATNEFKSRDFCRRNPVVDMVGGGCWRLKPGQWTDDTSMAFAMGAAIVEKGAFDAVAIMKNFVDWRQGIAFGPSDGRGCFDIGGTTAAALGRFARDGNPFAGRADAHTAANGCLMRLAPVPLYTFGRGATAREFCAGGSARLTHAEPRCIDATVFLAEFIHAILSGPTSVGGFAAQYKGAGRCETPQLKDMLARQCWRDVTGNSVRGSGYVIDCLEASLWAFYQTESFAECVLAAANLGDDADTTGAVAGQLAGAWYGYERIPASWREKLDRRDELLAVADELFALATGTPDPAPAAA